MALLTGRPLALVLAATYLDLQGLPVIHQGCNSLRQDLQRNTRDTDGFTRVGFPISIGEDRQLNDGVIGFWQEFNGGYADNTFYAPQHNPSRHTRIQTYANDTLNLHLAIDAPALTLSILMDPRGKLHATSGVLPTKVIDIPPEKYVAALQAIEVSFLTAPILSDELRPPGPSSPHRLHKRFHRSGRRPFIHRRRWQCGCGDNTT